MFLQFDTILKMRDNEFDPVLRELLLSKKGLEVGDSFNNVEALLSGFGRGVEAAAPGDGPCMVLLTRVESLRDNPPPADWDGSWRLDQKNPATQPTEVGRP